MSLVVGASERGAAPETSNFFLDLPDELLQVVLGYMTAADGVRFMVTQKTLHARVIEILLTNQRGYFTSLCKKMSSEFLFATETYRQDRKKQSEEILCEGAKSLTFTQLNEMSKEFGRRMFPSNAREKWFDQYYKVDWTSFFYPFQERVAEVFVSLGKELVRKQGTAQQRVLELVEENEEDPQKQEQYIEIALDFGGAMPAEKAFHLINKITNERTKEKVMHQWIKLVNRDDPFLKTETFFDWIAPVPLIKYLEITYERGKGIIDLLNKTIRHPNESVRKEVLFLFFGYWWGSGMLFDEPRREEVVSKIRALIETLPEAERNVGVFQLLQSMLDSRFTYEDWIPSYDYPACSLAYLQHQVDEQGFSPLHIIESLPGIMKHIEEHKRFHKSLGLYTHYKGRHISYLIEFVKAAKERARTDEERSLIWASALKQLSLYNVSERDLFLKEVPEANRIVT